MDDKVEKKKILIIGAGNTTIASGMAKALIHMSNKMVLKNDDKNNGCWWQQFEKTKNKHSKY